MKKHSARRLQAVFLVISGLGLFFWPGAGVFAQAAKAPGDAAPPANDQVVLLEKFTVTGSHIPTTETAAEAGAYPVTLIDRRTIEQTGYENTAQLLQSFPVFNQGAIPISNNDTGFSRGATGISLHGLGPDATLVLVDGHRVGRFPVGQYGEQAFVDLNTIPQCMIERIDIFPVGASAIYGADAVAGVVNILLKKDYKGAEIHLKYDNTTDKDSSTFTASLLAGVTNETTNLMIEVNYQKRNSITDADRDYTLVPALLSTSSSPINAQVTITAYNQALGLPLNHARPAGVTRNIFFVTPGITPVPGGNTPNGNTLSSNGLAVSPSTNFGNTPASEYIPNNNRQSIYDYNQNAWSLPSSKRSGLVLSGDHKLFGTQNIKAYWDGNYQASETENQSAPAPTLDFALPGQAPLIIPANTANPFLFGVSKSNGSTITAVFTNPGGTFPAGSVPGPGTTADSNGKAQRLAPAGAYNPFNPFNEDISGTSRYRLQDFGNRVWDDTNESFLGTAGIRGENILDKYDFDAGVRYSQNTYRTNDTQVSASKFNRILNANDPIFNPNDPSYIGTTVPYNPFGYYVNPIPNNALLVRYATIHVHDTDFSSLGNGYFTVDTTDLFKLPAGSVGAATGLEYRVETLNQMPDPETAAGDIIGTVQKLPVDRRRLIGSAFAELKVPIISPRQQIIGLHSLSADIAGRYEDFLTSHESKTVPQAGISYQPFDDTLALRASAGRGFLAPSMEKLYSPGIVALPSLIDRRTNTSLTEVPAKDVGNSGLRSETSNSYSAGFVWTPQFAPLKGFTTNLDLWRIDRNGTALVDNQNTLDRFFGTVPGGNLPGETVFLDPTTGNVVEVVSVYHNAGKSIAKGADIGASYVRQTDWGRFDLSAAISFLHSFRQATAPGQSLQERVDTAPDVATGEDAYLRRRATTTMAWSYKHYYIGATGHFIDGFQDFDANGNPRRVGSSWTWDLQLGYTFDNELGRYLKGARITVGSINILDRHPPLDLDRGNNPNNYPGTLYTSEGRRVYVALDKKF